MKREVIINIEDDTIEREKYRAIEASMFALRLAGYSIEDNIYLLLIKERATLEKSILNDI